MIISLIAIAFTPILGINIMNNKDVNSDFINKYINIFLVSWFIMLNVNRYLEIKAKYLYKKYLLPIKIKINELYGIIKKIKRRTKNAEKKDTNL